MDGIQFDSLARSLARTLWRRSLGGLGIGVAVVSLLPHGGVAKTAPQGLTKGKKKVKPLVLNQFGCVDVGGHCQGNSANCCSGVCQGSKPKPGESDKSVCVGHNEGGCTPARISCIVSSPADAVCNLSNVAFCLATTGNGSFCATQVGFSLANNCKPCTKDTDCVALGFPPGSACVLFNGNCTGACATTGNRGCVAPGI